MVCIKVIFKLTGKPAQGIKVLVTHSCEDSSKIGMWQVCLLTDNEGEVYLKEPGRYFVDIFGSKVLEEYIDGKKEIYI